MTRRKFVRFRRRYKALRVCTPAWERMTKRERRVILKATAAQGRAAAVYCSLI